MTGLRQVVGALGHRDVATYIQTGNVVFTTARADAAALARELEAAIAAQLDVRPCVIVLSRDELAGVIARNPYSAAPDPRYVHGVFLPAEPDEAMARVVREAVAAAARTGSADEARLLGRTLYLHT